MSSVDNDDPGIDLDLNILRLAASFPQSTVLFLSPFLDLGTAFHSDLTALALQEFIQREEPLLGMMIVEVLDEVRGAGGSHAVEAERADGVLHVDSFEEFPHRVLGATEFLHLKISPRDGPTYPFGLPDLVLVILELGQGN